MIDFIKFHLRLDQMRSNLTISTILCFILWGVLIPKSAAQEMRCKTQTPTFTGFPEQTLCEKYPNFSCDLQIGAGTQFPKSSLLGASISGNVCIVGNFEVDVPFAFSNAVVKINPGVTIAISPSPNGYDPGSSLVIENSMLFACAGLWNGITLGQLSSIYAYNSEIEDAEKAVFASSFCALTFKQTTFDRNRVGIELFTPFPNIFIPGPVMWGFTGNLFTCTAPLNGTTNEITQVGVKLRDADLFPFFTNSNNTFRDIEDGIIAESSGANSYAFCNVFVNNYHFDKIRDKGIDFRGRNLDVKNSRFTTIGDKGIHFSNSSYLSVENNQFTMDALGGLSDQTRVMIDAENPLPGNNLRIMGNNLSTAGTMAAAPLDGIRLISNEFSIFNALIRENTFSFQNTGIIGSSTDAEGTEIEVLGFLSADSDIDIEANTFNLYEGAVNKNRSIKIETGTVNVVGNDFKGAGTHIFAFGGINPNFSILDNDFIPALNFGTGVELLDVPQSTICSNTNPGASNVSYLLRGQNLGTIFSGNQTLGGWQHTFWITGSQPVIGQQIHTGNEWGPAIVANNGSNFFVRPFLAHSDPDPDIVEMSKFEIHTPQSVWNGSQYTFFSPFHPATDEIVPDFNDEFFDQDPGTPTVSCLAQLQNPDEVDLLIANGGFAGRITNVGSVFDAKRYLYRKLQENPTYVLSHPTLGAFLASEQNTNVGQFYLLEKAINDAEKLASTEKLELENAQTKRDAIAQEMAKEGLSESQLLAKISELSGVGEDIQKIVAQQEAKRDILIANSISIWQSIAPQNVFEQYRKDVLGIYLNAQTLQGGLLNEAQVTTLLDIANLCSEDGGAAVYLAQGLLPDCHRADIIELTKQCHQALEMAPRDQVDTRHIRISDEAQPQVSPNPARDWVNILSVRPMEGRAELFALTGQLLASKTIVLGENPLWLNLNSGIYVLKITYDNGDSSSHKLVISR